MSAYYNDNNSFVCNWLENLIAEGLIADGDVDRRSIADVKPQDLKGYTQAHFFAGIGGWSYALRLAGWPDDRPVWTGSCPCQPFSSATHGQTVGELDARNLWPEWFRLISTVKPCVVFGEQVATAIGWFDGVCNDLEELDYKIGAAVLPACSIGADHKRERLYFVAHPNGSSKSGIPINEKAQELPRNYRQSEPVEAEDGLSARVDLLRAYGNAIVPQVAAEFIAAYMEALSEKRIGD